MRKLLDTGAISNRSGRPKVNWVKDDLRRVGANGWERTAQDRGRWRLLVGKML